jgi:hypothetical protein
MTDAYFEKEHEIVDEPLTPEELEQIRQLRQNPAYTPAAASTPAHEHWTDTASTLLDPFKHQRFDADHPPTMEEVETLMATHPARVARPGVNMFDYYWKTLDLLTHYCDRMGPGWEVLKAQLQTRLAAHQTAH